MTGVQTCALPIWFEMALLNVDKLSVHFGDESAPFRAVDRISYSVKQGEVVGIVGESGSG